MHPNAANIVSRYLHAWLTSDHNKNETAESGRGPGRCGGKQVRCVFFAEDSGNVWTHWEAEFRCEACGQHAYWVYDN